MAETTQTINVTEPPDFLKEYYDALAQRGMDLGNTAFTPYTGTRVSPWTTQQTQAADLIQNRAVSGSPYMQNAGDWFNSMLAGDMNVAGIGSGGTRTSISPYLTSGISDPAAIASVTGTYGPQSIASGGTRTAVDPTYGASSIASGGSIGSVATNLGPKSIASGGTASVGTNAYLGLNNPYLSGAINQAMGDVSSRIDSKFNGNAFGGTAHQQTLARELGNVANNMRFQDYANQQGLAESDVNRRWQNQQYNINNQNSLNQFNAGLGMQNAATANQMGLANAGIQEKNIANQNNLNQFNAGLQNQNAAIANAMGQFNSGLQSQNIADQNALNQYNSRLGWDYANAKNQMGLANAGINEKNVANALAASQFNANIRGQNAATQNATAQFNSNLQSQNIADKNALNQFNANLQQQNIARQFGTLGLAPQFANQDYTDFSALMGLGNQLQGYNQQIADANYQEFLRQQQYPTQQLNWMQMGLNPSQSAFTNSTTTAPTPQTSTMANVIGGGLTGYGALSGINSIYQTGIDPYWGALAGGLLGAYA